MHIVVTEHGADVHWISPEIRMKMGFPPETKSSPLKTEATGKLQEEPAQCREYPGYGGGFSLPTAGEQLECGVVTELSGFDGRFCPGMKEKLHQEL